MVTLSDDEVAVLRRLAYERRTPMSKLMREAIDAHYGTSDAEIQPPGRRKRDQP